MSLNAERLERRKQLIRYVSYGKTVDRYELDPIGCAHMTDEEKADLCDERRPFGYVVDGFTVKIWAD